MRAQGAVLYISASESQEGTWAKESLFVISYLWWVNEPITRKDTGD